MLAVDGGVDDRVPFASKNKTVLVSLHGVPSTLVEGMSNWMTTPASSIGRYWVLLKWVETVSIAEGGQTSTGLVISLNKELQDRKLDKSAATTRDEAL